MQGSKVRRELSSFHPFQPEEMVESKFFSKDDNCNMYSYYPTFSGRLRVGRMIYPDLSIRTKIVVAELRGKAIVQAFVSASAPCSAPGMIPVTRVRGAGIGTADKEGDGRLIDSLVELAESRAIGRALRALGIGEGVGSEEMDRAGILTRLLPPVPDASPLASPAPTTPTTTPAAPANGSAAAPQKPALAAGRRALGEKIMEQVGGDREKYARIIGAIIPGMASLANLGDLQFDIVKLVVEAAVICDTPAAVHATKQALMGRIKAQTPVEQWTANHLLAAREAIRGAASKPIQDGTLIDVPADDCPF